MYIIIHFTKGLPSEVTVSSLVHVVVVAAAPSTAVNRD